MWTPEYFVRQVKLPDTVDGVVVPNDDGTFDIYLNASQPRELQEKWLRHEVRHIKEDHFYRAMDIALIEGEAEGRRVHQAAELPAADGRIMEFLSPNALLRYYRDDPDRILRDYT